MATRRMISKEIIDTDRFMSLSYEAQALYIQMIINADDEGFVGKAKRIARALGVSENALEELKSEEYLIEFETGVVVIRHWFTQNTIQKDRFKETTYTNEKALLTQNDAKEYIL